MSCSDWLDANAAEIEELRVQLAGAKAELKTSDEYLEIANGDCSTLRAQLAAAEKERDGWKAAHDIEDREKYAALQRENEREAERDALAARVAKLEAALETTGFEGGWKEMEARGYQYGRDALMNVAFGWELAFAAVRARAGLGEKT